MTAECVYVMHKTNKTGDKYSGKLNIFASVVDHVTLGVVYS